MKTIDKKNIFKLLNLISIYITKSFKKYKQGNLQLSINILNCLFISISFLFIIYMTILNLHN